MDVDLLILRLSAATALGMLAGLDRELRGKPAGLKTYGLVALGSAAFTAVTLTLVDEGPSHEPVRYDPLRLIAGVTGGIGFLGAGTIIQGRNGVSGITTASGIWIVGAVGVACGAGYYMIAVLTTAGMLLVLLPIGYMEQKWVTPDEAKDANIEPKDSAGKSG